MSQTSYDATGRPVQKKTSPWVYVGIGCLIVVVLGGAVVATLGFFAYRKGKELAQEMKDPAARAAKARTVLGGEELPPGYHAVIALSVPFVMDMAILTDAPPRANGEPGENGDHMFFYMNMISQGRDQQELKDYFEGKSDDPEVLRRNNIRVRHSETLKRGIIDAQGHRLLYLAQRGEASMQGHSSKEGITTILMVECPGQSRMRMGIWSGPDPGGEELAGTTADEATIKEFMSHFQPCRS